MNAPLQRMIILTLILTFSIDGYAQSKTQTEGDDSSKPVAYGLVVDNTGSLRQHFAQVINTGKAVIESNQLNDEVFITRFTHREKITVVQDFTSQKVLLANALDEMYVEGGLSAIVDAVYLSGQRLVENERVNKLAMHRRALVLITDGADEKSYYRTEMVLSMLREKRIRVYVMGFPQAAKTQGAEDRARKLLNRLAEESGGRAYLPMSNAEAKKAAKEILAEIRMPQQE